ncbi:MAG: PD-(D/E)XK nuclease family protein [Selenomonadaceae bacterium]|nr:PD-(D/E)XK nuclease family protein [Selenomonadaceae bacterium]
MNNFDATRKLLAEVGIIHEKYRDAAGRGGENFNVFSVLQSAHSEVAVCRLLAELLSPTGTHGQGIKFLRLFMQSVLRLEVSDDELTKAYVYREYPITGQRRIDIVIVTPDFFLPIEVKIYAVDQPGQCRAYWEEAARHMKQQAKVYYLTLFGTLPGEDSRRDLNAKSIVCLSFADDILRWLDAVLQDSALLAPPVAEILRQFAAAVRRWTNVTEGKERQELIELLSGNSENICTAQRVYGVLNDAKRRLLPLVFLDIACQIDENFHHIYGGNLMLLPMDIKEETIRRFYESPKNSYAHVGIYYGLNDIDLGEKYEMRFAVEVEQNLYCQYLVYDRAADKLLDNIPDELLPRVNTHFNVDMGECEGVHPTWEYLPLISGRETVNFRDLATMDEEILALFDAEKRKEAVARVMTVIEKMLKKMK